MTPSAKDPDIELAEQVREYREDPLGFVRDCYPWGEGPLTGEKGPDANQTAFLKALGEMVRERNFQFGSDSPEPAKPIKMAMSKGHGTGGSVTAAWLVDWLMSTWPGSIGTITAGTAVQLEERTWAAVQHWTKLCATGHWFDIQASGIYAKPGICGKSGIAPESWKVLAYTCKEENAQSFAGQHARTSASWYCFDEACHDNQTDILTRRGWLRFCELRPEDEVLSMDPRAHIAEYVKPIAMHASYRSGEMCSYEVKGCNFKVTPNHKMYGRNRDGGKGIGVYRPWKFKEAGDLAKKHSYFFMTRGIDWRVPDISTFTVPGFKALIKNHTERVVNFDQWMEFLGWYYSEGSLGKRINSLGETEHVTTTLTNKDTGEVELVAGRMGFTPKPQSGATTRQINIHDRALSEHLASFGVGCLVKRIPDYVMQASARQINIFLDAYVKGDGYDKTPDRSIIYTSSVILANQLQELCLKGGANSVIRKRSLAGKPANFSTHIGISSCDGYVVSRARWSASIMVRQKNIKRNSYDGMVYCAELPKYHLLYTRRNGTCMWSGNSEVPDKIWETASGGLTDGQPMWFAWGQCVRNTGMFYRVNFGDQAQYWDTRRVDSRTSRFTNKGLIEEWKHQYGEDSDFFRVRVLGYPPRASELQFIDWQRIRDAQERQVTVFPDEPLIAGVDCSDGGSAWNVCRFRRGYDMRSIPAIRIPGEATRNDPHVLTARLAEALRDQRPERRIAAMFIDAAFGAHIAERLRSMGYNQVHTVRFGGASSDQDCLNWRAQMYKSAKEWLLLGGIPSEEEDKHLGNDFAGPGYKLNSARKLVIESKSDMAKRGVKSPDDGDSAVLTFAQPVAPQPVAKPSRPAPGPSSRYSYMG